jgi:hypothetical protein
LRWLYETIEAFCSVISIAGHNRYLLAFGRYVVDRGLAFLTDISIGFLIYSLHMLGVYLKIGHN